MGKDQRAKHHGLDVRANRKKREQIKQAFVAPPPPKKHKGTR